MSMRSSCSPTRPLSQHSPHLFHSTELQGRTAKRAYHDNSTLGKWENLIGKGEIQTPVKRNNNASFNQSPRKAQNDSYQPVAAGRPTSAVSPSSFFDNSSQPESSSKVSTSDYYAGRPSKWGNQMNRTLCVDTTQQGGIRVFRDREESPFEKTADKRPLVAYSPTQNTWNSHISVLPCTTYTNPRIAMVSSPEAARRRQIQSPLMVHPENIKFEAEERSSMRALTADQKERKEVHKTYVRCVNMTAKDEVSNVVVNQGKRDHNKQSHASFLADEGRLNPNTRGKRMNSPDYIKRESAMEAEKFMVQPLNKMTKGKKFEYRSLSGYIPPPKPASVETCTGKAKTFFSYRNFASQFNLKHNS